LPSKFNGLHICVVKVDDKTKGAEVFFQTGKA
jgi:hypothetical protein